MKCLSALDRGVDCSISTVPESQLEIGNKAPRLVILTPGLADFQHYFLLIGGSSQLIYPYLSIFMHAYINARITVVMATDSFCHMSYVTHSNTHPSRG